MKIGTPGCPYLLGVVNLVTALVGRSVDARGPVDHASVGLVSSPDTKFFCARPAALSKNRVWTPSLVKLGRNYTSVVSGCRTNQIAQVK